MQTLSIRLPRRENFDFRDQQAGGKEIICKDIKISTTDPMQISDVLQK